MERTLAVISDIHGNVDALKAVLRDIASQSIKNIVNLGDHFSGPLAAAETADLLMDSGIICIRGNHDRLLIGGDKSLMGASDRAAHAQLESTHLDWLRTLPAARRLSKEIFMCHGTPRCDMTYWLDKVTPTGDVVLQDEWAIASELEGTASLFLCGHTHIRRRVDIGEQTILNPGSVGQPAYNDATPIAHVVETGTPAANYATVRATEVGWATCHHSVPYDPARMIRMADAGGRPDWVRALQSGRA